MLARTTPYAMTTCDGLSRHQINKVDFESPAMSISALVDTEGTKHIWILLVSQTQVPRHVSSVSERLLVLVLSCALHGFTLKGMPLKKKKIYHPTTRLSGIGGHWEAGRLHV